MGQKVTCLQTDSKVLFNIRMQRIIYLFPQTFVLMARVTREQAGGGA